MLWIKNGSKKGENIEKFKAFNENTPVNKAKELLDWNRKNLVSTSYLKKEEIAHFFAEEFSLIANGRCYEANYENYLYFLHTFKERIFSISYDVKEYILSDHTVVMPLSSTIIRTDGNQEYFEAILILKFNSNGKIILWHEVYVGVNSK